MKSDTHNPGIIWEGEAPQRCGAFYFIAYRNPNFTDVRGKANTVQILKQNLKVCGVNT